ncbi:MAG TPA: hypothetical protein VNL71_25760 [Chloroflexota bacterium]|nr:hypothetical protein [Chloroflexota bacterium]
MLNSPDAANGKPATIHLPALPASGSLSVVEDDSIFAPDLAPSGASTGGSHAGTPDPLSAPPPISAPVFAASGAAQVTAGQPITLVMRPTAAGAALLSRPHPLIHVDYVLTFRPTSGTAQTLTLGGIIPTTIPDPYVPVITGVAFHGTAANPRIVVTGTGFGTAPAPDPPYVASGHSYCPAVHGVAGYDYGTSLYITTPNLSAGRYRPELNELDCVGLIVQRYTPTEVEFTPDVAYQDPVYSKGRLMAGAPYTISVNSASFSGKVAYTP